MFWLLLYKSQIWNQRGKCVLIIQKPVVQLLNRVWLFAVALTTCQASLPFSIYRSLLKLMSIESVMSSNCLILCCPLLLLPLIFLSIIVFSSESALCIRWPKYWSFNFSICSLVLYLFTLILIICKCWCIAVVNRAWLVTGTLVQWREYWAQRQVMWNWSTSQLALLRFHFLICCMGGLSQLGSKSLSCITYLRDTT